MKKVFLMVTVGLFLSCGTQKEYVVERPVEQEPPPETDPPGDQISYAQMEGYLDQYCGSCHETAGFMQNENALRSSTVRQRLVSRSMPPASSGVNLPEVIRIRMQNFF